MFRNFGKVFAFSIHNQMGSKGFKAFTITLALLFLIVPAIVMMLLAGKQEEEEKTIESCGAENVFIVSDYEAVPNLLLFHEVTEENYKEIRYKNADSVDAALESAKAAGKAFVLHFYPEEDYIRADIILPETDGREEDAIDPATAKNYFAFMEANPTLFSLLLTGLNQSEIMGLMPGNGYSTYTESGYAAGITIDEDKQGADELIRDSVLEVFQMILPYFTIMLLYFLILSYGNATAQSMVMEKESKLMDTMLISLHPEAMVAGKFLAIVCSGLLQVFGWLLSIIVGMFAGVKLTEATHPGYESPITVFFSFMNELGIFQPVHVIIGMLFLVVGFVLYLSLATIAGSISSNREEVAGQSSLYVMPLLAAFMLVMMGGGLTAGGAPLWMDYIPFTAALLMPSQLALGTVTAATGLVSLLITLALTLLLVITAGRLYKAMSLYKGNKVKLADVLRLVRAK